MRTRKDIWDAFLNERNQLKEAPLLFETDANTREVQSLMYGTQQVRVLRRTVAVDGYLGSKSIKLRNDAIRRTNRFEGLLYIMFRRDNDVVIPLYIGKTEKIGKSGKTSSLLNGACPKPRWDYGPDYHVGGLSSVTLTGHAPSSQKKHYNKWAKALFSKVPSDRPTLKYPIFLWVELWQTSAVGVWEEFGATPLCLQETLLINLAYSLYPNELLNTEGILRQD